MKVSFADYLKLFFFIIFTLATFGLYSASYFPGNDYRTYMVSTIACSFFAFVFSEALVDIKVKSMYMKTKLMHPNHHVSFLLTILNIGTAVGYLHATILLLTTLTFVSILINNWILGVLSILLGSGALILFLRKMHQIKSDMTPKIPNSP